MIKTNYHTHTTRCQHAEGSDEAYVQAAIRQGFTQLGISDHAPWPAYPYEHHRIRMHLDEFPEYVQSIRRLERQYSGRIKLLVGLESEYYPERMEFMKELLEKTPLDYLIFGNHFNHHEANGRYFGHYGDTANLLKDYERISVEGLQSGLFSLFAHPDLFVRSLERWDSAAEESSTRILIAAKEAGVPIEYNLGGVRNAFSSLTYPHLPFWELAAKIGNQVVIGVDAHSPSDLDDNKTYTDAQALLKRIGITPLEELPLKSKMRKD